MRAIYATTLIPCVIISDSKKIIALYKNSLMKYCFVLIILLISLQLSAQKAPVLRLTNISKPEKTVDFHIGDRVVIYFQDTSEICGKIKAIDNNQVVIDSVVVPVNSIQIIVERNPKSFLYKLGGTGMIIGGTAIAAGGFYLLAKGILPPSAAGLYLVPAGLVSDYFGIRFIIKGINMIGNKGKQFDIGYRYKIEVTEE
ncbi:hypothetical protein SDC9_164449 [bioreactor metagenome]|uniref:Uncharacterized protein n=1 Tax=bioreactor metagenome TaxID=1076179 RepID=A0A645FUB9_9ZZZZ